MKDPKELEKEKAAKAELVAQLEKDIAAGGKKVERLKAEMEKEADPDAKEDLRLSIVVWNREVSRMKSDLEGLKRGEKDGHPEKRKVRSIFG